MEQPLFYKALYSMWLFHLHSALKNRAFFPVFPLAGATAKAFFRLSLWSFKEKNINHSLEHSLLQRAFPQQIEGVRNIVAVSQETVDVLFLEIQKA